MITIDGTTGSGKTTIARELAKLLNHKYVDCEAIYRTVAMKILEEKIDLNNEDEVSRVFRSMDFEQDVIDGKSVITCNGIDISNDLHTPEIETIRSQLESQPGVRFHITAVLHVWGSSGNMVIEGQDVSVYIFPDSDYKFFLDASPEIRLERKYQALIAKGFIGSRDDVHKEITQRDAENLSRKMIPSKKASDTLIIDTGNLTTDQVVDKLFAIIRN